MQTTGAATVSLCANCSELLEELGHSDQVEDALRELVELKRMKDATGPTDEYRRRHLIAWRNAFRALDIVGDPKP